MDPVCPQYTNCGKKIRPQHLVSCKALDYREEYEEHRNMFLNREYSHYWYNFNLSSMPQVYKLRNSQQFFILQGRSTGTSFIFYIIQHNQENISEHQYIARLEVYGVTKNIIISQTITVCPRLFKDRGTYSELLSLFSFFVGNNVCILTLLQWGGVFPLPCVFLNNFYAADIRTLQLLHFFNFKVLNKFC